MTGPTARRVTATLTAQLALAAASLILQIYWARSVESSEIGIYYKFAILTDVIFAFSTLSIDQAVVKLGYTTARTQAALCILYLSVALSVGLGATAVCLLPVIDANVDGSELVGILSVASSAILALSNYAAAQRFASGRIERVVFWRAVAFGAGCVASVVMVEITHSAMGMVARDLVFSLVCLCTFVALDRPSVVPRWNRDEIRSVLSFSARVWVVNVAAKVAMRCDYLLIGRVSSANESFGLYAQIRSVAEGILSLVTYQIQTLMFVYFVDREKQRGQRREPNNPSIKILLVLVGAMAILVSFSEQVAALVLPTLIGERGHIAPPIVPGILLSCFGLLAMEASLSYLKAKGSHLIMVIPYLLKAVIIVLIAMLSVGDLSISEVSWVGGLSTLAAALVLPILLRNTRREKKRTEFGNE